MASLYYGRVVGGTVLVHDNDTVDHLLIDSDDNIYSQEISRDEASRRSKLKRPQSTPHPSRRASSYTRSDVDSATGTYPLRLQGWLSNSAVSSIQERTDGEAKKTKKMYETVLETEDSFVKEMEGVVCHKDMLDLRKRELLYKNWSDKVHEPVRQQIVRQMGGPGYPELQRRKRQLHKEYLEHVNKKGHVFLDTIAPDEYYALSLHPTRPSLLVAQTRQLRDPLLAQEREKHNEDRVIFRCATGATLGDKALAKLQLPPLPLVPLGRHGTECSSWLGMPMGDIESPVRLASRRRMSCATNESHFTLEKWGKPTHRSVVDVEMGVQRRGGSLPRDETPATMETGNIKPTTRSVAIQCD